MRLFVHRVVMLVPTLLMVSVAVFLLGALVPGDPAITLAGGASADPTRIAQIRAELHLNESLIHQYLRWLGGAVHFDFGSSLLTLRPIGHELQTRLPTTLSLVGLAALLAVLVATPLGIWAGAKPNGWCDRFSQFVAALSTAMPSLVVAPVLIVVLAAHRHVLPPSGYIKFAQSPREWFRHLILPAVSLGLFLAASLTRQLRGAIADSMNSNYIRTLWANGTRRRHIYLHALRNAAPPGLTIFALQVGALLGGTIVVEQIFGIPGVGQYLFAAIIGRDLPVVEAVAIVFVVSQLLISLGIDLMYALLNPKLRTA